jgi:Flp pilus assembly protein TadB
VPAPLTEKERRAILEKKADAANALMLVNMQKMADSRAREKKRVEDAQRAEEKRVAAERAETRRLYAERKRAADDERREMELESRRAPFRCRVTCLFLLSLVSLGHFSYFLVVQLSCCLTRLALGLIWRWLFVS